MSPKNNHQRRNSYPENNKSEDQEQTNDRKRYSSFVFEDSHIKKVEHPCKRMKNAQKGRVVGIYEYKIEIGI